MQTPDGAPTRAHGVPAVPDKAAAQDDEQNSKNKLNLRDIGLKYDAY